MTSKPRIFFLNLDYYLSREIPLALQELGLTFLNFRPNDLGIPVKEFLQRTAEAISRFRPDFVLTVNALGLDETGYMAQFFDARKIPLLIWFVDSPDLFLFGREHIYPQNSLFFSCDPDGREKAAGTIAKDMHYLPLAADKTRMKKPGDTPRIPVSFLGDTWSVKIAACLKNHDLPAYFLRESGRVARAMADNQPGNGLEFIRNRFPRLYSRMSSELDPGNQNGLLHLIYWRANKLYRKMCVKQLLEFKPLIAGDKYWEKILDPARFDYHPPIAYGKEAFKLYSMSRINFACSSVQMSGAVTQRVFDVPAAGGFLITDKRKQLQEMFEAGKEAVCYEDPREVPEMVRHYLANERERMRIIKAARRRMGAEHTYAHRLRKLLSIAEVGF